MNILDATISHILSQLTYRWFAHDGFAELSDVQTIYKLTLNDWQHYLNHYRDHPKKNWSKILSDRLDNEISVVLAEIDKLVSGPKYQYMSICDPNYPSLLRHIAQPPYGLFYLGDRKLWHRKSLAIVGARKVDDLCAKLTYKLAYELAEKGFVIVSGGALGCDTAAHRGALKSGSATATIAVLANGIDNWYPRQNYSLFHQIEHLGLIVTEKLPGAGARPMDFPIRNRIIAGLVPQVVIMQAAKKSGAMNTAHTALAEGRDVIVFDQGEADIRFEGNQILKEYGASTFSNIATYMNLNHQQY